MDPNESALLGRRRGSAASAALLACLSLGSCDAAPEVRRDPEPLMQTSQLRYTLTSDELGFRTTIPYTFRNTTGGPVYLPNCEGDVRPILQVELGGAWFDAWEPFRIRCVHAPVVIGPGELFDDTLRFFGAPSGSNLVPAFAFAEVEGVYRLLWTQAVSRHAEGRIDPTALLPLEQRTSNRFVLERGDTR